MGRLDKTSEGAPGARKPGKGKGDFAKGMRKASGSSEGPDYARGQRTDDASQASPDFARGQREASPAQDSPDFARGQHKNRKP